MNEFNASYIGAMCAEFRRLCTNATQQDVANKVGVARESVSKFERGVVCNGLVFMWYIKQGLFEWMPIEKFNGWRGFYRTDCDFDQVRTFKLGAHGESKRYSQRCNTSDC